MQEEKKIVKSAPKKKVKNKGWDCVASEQIDRNANKIPQPALIEPFKQEKRYSNITNMSLKYSFNIEAVIGSGFASTVYLGARNETKEMVCIKAIDLMALGFSSPYISLIHQQIQCLKLFNSNFIVKLYDVYQSETFYYLVMQLCTGGDLYKMLKLSPGNLPSRFITTIMNQIIQGVEEIHAKGIVHRDIKTENIFITYFPQNQNEEIKVKIGDLGFCITLQKIQELKLEGKTIENVGSPIYMSPQACRDHEYSFNSDVYALGIIWYELYHKRAPWEASSEEQLLQRKLSMPVSEWRQNMEPEIKTFILKCINNNAKQRPTCNQMLAFAKSLL